MRKNYRILVLLAALFIVSALAFIAGCGAGTGGGTRGYFWNVQNTDINKNLYGITFKDVNTGWVAGETGTVLKTTNSAIDWTKETTGTTSNLRDIKSYGDDVWACGDSMTVIRSTNGGSSWENLNPLRRQTGEESLHSVSLGGYPGAWFCGDDGVVQFTEDGTVWVAFDTGTTQNLYDIVVYNDGKNIAAVGEDGTVVMSDDSGTSWRVVDSGSNDDLFAVTAVGNGSSLKLWAVGSNGTILYYTAATGEWNDVKSYTDEDLQGVCFGNQDTGWVVGNNGKILKTNDGGLSWFDQYSESDENLHDVYFSSTDLVDGFICGNKGLILKTITGGGNPDYEGH